MKRLLLIRPVTVLPSSDDPFGVNDELGARVAGEMERLRSRATREKWNKMEYYR